MSIKLKTLTGFKKLKNYIEHKIRMKVKMRKNY